MTKQTLRFGLIGAGRIGWPVQGRPGASLVTHADAIWSDPDCRIQAVIEPNRTSSVWSNHADIPVFDNLDKALHKYDFDAFIVATPTASRTEILERLLEHQPMAVVSEKPITCRGVDSLNLVRRYRQKGIPFWVNLSRRFLSVYGELRERFQCEERVLSARIAYAKGIKHNGIHALDLATMLFGQIESWKVLNSRVDFDLHDPTLTMFAQFEHCPQFLLEGLDHRVVTHFELDVWTDRSRYIIDRDHTRLRRFGFRARDAGGERALELVENTPIPHHQSLANLIVDIKRGIYLGTEPAVTPEDVASLEVLIDDIVSANRAEP